MRALQAIATLGVLACGAAASAQSEVIYDSLWIVDDKFMDASSGNAIGGLNGPLREVTDAQIGDDFELDAPFRITRVIADIVAWNDTVPAEGVWVQFFAHDAARTKPEEQLFADQVVKDFPFTEIETPLRFKAWRLDLDLSDAGIVLPEGTWWISSQPLDIETNGDWFWYLGSISVDTIGHKSHVRDGAKAHGNKYRGLWRSDTWIPHDFRGNNTLSMRIEGVRLSECDPCDANCDGSVDLVDVEPFIALILGKGEPCAFCSGDTNDDGSIDLTDVEGFIDCLLG